MRQSAIPFSLQSDPPTTPRAGKPIQYKAGLLASGSGNWPAPSHSIEQWRCADNLSGYSGGSATDSHRLPLKRAALHILVCRKNNGSPAVCQALPKKRFCQINANKGRCKPPLHYNKHQKPPGVLLAAFSKCRSLRCGLIIIAG